MSVIDQANHDSGVPDSVAAELASYFDDAAKRLRKIIIDPKGKSPTSKEFYQARAAQLLAQVDREIAKLKARGTAWVEDRVPDVFAAALERGRIEARKALADAGKNLEAIEDAVKFSFAQVDTRALSVLANDTIADIHRVANSTGEHAKDTLRKTAQLKVSNGEINRILAGGVIDGAPVVTIRELREALRRVHGEKVVVMSKGGPMHFEAGEYAEMVARTRTREAVVKARHQGMQEYGLDLVAITGSRSNNPCTAYRDQVFSLSGQSQIYKPYSSLPNGGPPFHPRCTKGTRPFIEEAASDRQLALAEVVEPNMLGVDWTEASRRFKDLNVYKRVNARYDQLAKQEASS